jgi:GT2 family glycosyltransferase
VTGEERARPGRAPLRELVTVVVITRDRRDELLPTLDRLADLPGSPPVIVLDNGSTDGSAAATRAAHPRMTVVPLGRNLAAAARNIGVGMARTPYVAFSDDDLWWAPDALPAAVEVLEREPRTAVVAARVLVGPEEREDPVCALMAASPLPNDGGSGGVPVVGFLAGAAVVRRDAFLAAGGFSRHFGVGGEEEPLAVDLLRAEWRLAYVPEVTAHHHPSPVRDPLRRRRVEVRNRLWAAWLRRRAPVALARTAEALKGAPVWVAVPALAEAARAIPWVLRERRPVPDDVEAMLRLVESGTPPGSGRTSGGAQAADLA